MNVLNIYVMALPADGFIGKHLPQMPTYASLSNGGPRASLEARFALGGLPFDICYWHAKWQPAALLAYLASSRNILLTSTQPFGAARGTSGSAMDKVFRSLLELRMIFSTQVKR